MSKTLIIKLIRITTARQHWRALTYCVAPKPQGVKPITSLEDLAGDPALTADFDVDEFLFAL